MKVRACPACVQSQTESVGVWLRCQSYPRTDPPNKLSGSSWPSCESFAIALKFIVAVAQRRVKQTGVVQALPRRRACCVEHVRVHEAHVIARLVIAWVEHRLRVSTAGADSNANAK
jgi:hypothetical protein